MIGAGGRIGDRLAGGSGSSHQRHDRVHDPGGEHRRSLTFLSADRDPVTVSDEHIADPTDVAPVR
jgi:hypothetical protein